MDETSPKHHDFAQLLFFIKSLYECLHNASNSSEMGFPDMAINAFVSYFDKPKYRELKLLHDHTRRFVLNFRNKYPFELELTNQLCSYLSAFEDLFDLFNQIQATTLESESIDKLHALFDKLQRIKFVLIISIVNHEDYLAIDVT